MSGLDPIYRRKQFGMSQNNSFYYIIRKISSVCLSLVLFFYSSNSCTNSFKDDAKKYDSGVDSRIGRQGDNVVEIHSSGYFNTLWYRTGKIAGNTMEWGPGRSCDTGLNASIAINGNTVVEAHKAADYDLLWYRIGTLDKTAQTITWGDPIMYDAGQYPSIAIYGDMLIATHQLTESHLDYCEDICETHCDTDCYFDIEGKQICEEHCNTDCHEQCYYYNTHKLFYRTGIINNSSKTIQWTYVDYYGEGQHPSITASGNTIIETHEAADSSDLIYKVGTLLDNIILWKSTAKYDKGVQPSVTSSGNLLVEMHKSQFYNRLWYHIGKLDPVTNLIQWSTSKKYNRGFKPSVALNNRSLLEVHTSDFFKTLYNNTGIVDENNALINWNFDLRQYDAAKF